MGKKHICHTDRKSHPHPHTHTRQPRCDQKIRNIFFGIRFYASTHTRKHVYRFLRDLLPYEHNHVGMMVGYLELVGHNSTIIVLKTGMEKTAYLSHRPEIAPPSGRGTPTFSKPIFCHQGVQLPPYNVSRFFHAPPLSPTLLCMLENSRVKY